MGNYCCSEDLKEVPKCTIIKKTSVSSNSTTVSQFNSVNSMKKHSHKLLQFLKEDSSKNVAISNKNIEGIEVVSELGKGGQSKVFEVIIKRNQNEKQNKNREEKIAVKRTNIKKQQNNMNSFELSKKLLGQNECPFLINSLFSFSCEKYLYSGMIVAEGGDLTSFLEKWRGKGDAFRKLQEVGIKFVLAGIVLGLQYLHNRGFIYCDLKTDNVLIDSAGYPLLSDFELMSDKSEIPVQQLQGTITAIGPEIHFSKKVDKAIDLWALGILLYFITYNAIPFSAAQIECPSFVSECKNQENNYFSSRKQVSQSLSNLINSLLRVRPQERIGYKSIEQIKNHSFFNCFDWQNYSTRQLQNPLAQIVKKYPIKSALKKLASNKPKQMARLRRERKYTL